MLHRSWNFFCELRKIYSKLNSNTSSVKFCYFVTIITIMFLLLRWEKWRRWTVLNLSHTCCSVSWCCNVMFILIKLRLSFVSKRLLNDLKWSNLSMPIIFIQNIIGTYVSAIRIKTINQPLYHYLNLISSCSDFSTYSLC